MDDINYMGIGIKEREKETKPNPVKTYYLTGEELEKYRNIEGPKEKIDPGGKIIMELYRRGKKWRKQEI